MKLSVVKKLCEDWSCQGLVKLCVVKKLCAVLCDQLVVCGEVVGSYVMLNVNVDIVLKMLTSL